MGEKIQTQMSDVTKCFLVTVLSLPSLACVGASTYMVLQDTMAASDAWGWFLFAAAVMFYLPAKVVANWLDIEIY